MIPRFSAIATINGPGSTRVRLEAASTAWERHTRKTSSTVDTGSHTTGFRRSRFTASLDRSRDTPKQHCVGGLPHDLPTGWRRGGREASHGLEAQGIERLEQQDLARPQIDRGMQHLPIVRAARRNDQIGEGSFSSGDAACEEAEPGGLTATTAAPAWYQARDDQSS